MITVVIILALILLNGLFVAAEFGLVGSSRTAIERRAAAGNRTARRIRRMLQDPRRQDRYIATAQLGITLASLGLGMYGEHAVAEWFVHLFESLGAARWVAAHTAASVLAIAVMTYLHIVLGEMVPKSLALQQPERTALQVTPAMLGVQLAMYPLVIGLNGIGNGVLRLFGINRQGATGEHYHTAEELQYIIRESQEGGLLRSESALVLRELFEFSDLTAGEVMVPRVRITGIPTDASPEEIIEMLRASQHTRYPVYDGDLDHIIGTVHVKDLLRQLLESKPVRTSHPRSVPYVPETATLDSVLRVMRETASEMIVVMDEHGGTAGILTIEDLFEEVIGEIEEDASERPDMYADAEGRLHAAGTVRIDEVGDRLGQVLEHEEVDTVSGLVLTLLGRPPAVGDVVIYDHIRFEVTSVQGHGVSECIVRLADPSEETSAADEMP